jgi:hypothetical protein
MGTGGSFCPTGEPMVTDFLSCIPLPASSTRIILNLGKPVARLVDRSGHAV